MTYQEHEQLFLHFDERLQNRQYRSQTEKEVLLQHAFIHQMSAADLLPEDVLVNAGLRMRDKPFPPTGLN